MGGTMLENEIWKDICGFNGWYQISNKARVRSWKNNKWPGKRENPKILKQRVSNTGYYIVGLAGREKPHTKTIHRLVAKHFIPNPENKKCVNHIDGNKLNNSIENLEWCTYKENDEHAAENNLKASCQDAGPSKLTNEEALQIRQMYKTGDYFQRELGEMFGISQHTVSKLVNGHTWKHLEDEINTK